MYHIFAPECQAQFAARETTDDERPAMPSGTAQDLVPAVPAPVAGLDQCRRRLAIEQGQDGLGTAYKSAGASGQAERPEKALGELRLDPVG